MKSFQFIFSVLILLLFVSYQESWADAEGGRLPSLSSELTQAAGPINLQGSESGKIIDITFKPVPRPKESSSILKSFLSFMFPSSYEDEERRKRVEYYEDLLKQHKEYIKTVFNADSGIYHNVYGLIVSPSQLENQEFVELLPEDLKVIQLHKYFDTISTLTNLNRFKNLTVLDFNNTKLAFADRIDRTKIGKMLRSNEVAFRDLVDISPLAHLPNLTSLTLRFRERDDSPFIGRLKTAPLSDLTNLTDLDLEGNMIQDPSYLGKLTKLKYLKLAGTGISNIGFLAGLDLIELNLAGNPVNGVSDLTSFKNLRTLNLRYTSVTAISDLASVDNLRNLDLSGTNVSDILPLFGLTHLESLNLEDSKVPFEQVYNFKKAIPGCKVIPPMRQEYFDYESNRDGRRSGFGGGGFGRLADGAVWKIRESDLEIVWLSLGKRHSFKIID